MKARIRNGRTLLIALSIGIAISAFVPASLFAAQTSATGTGIAVSDSLGRQVKLAKSALRIVSLSAAATETLFAIGAGTTVVGDTDYCDYPEAAKAITKIGGFDASTISIERIVSLRPDLVVSGGEIHKTIEASLQRLGIPFYAHDPQSFDEVAREMKSLGIATGHQADADNAAAAFLSGIEKVRSLTKNLKADERPSVFWEVYSDPLMTCGSISFPHALVVAAGGRDIFEDLPGSWPMVSSEEVARRAPAFILGADDNGYALTPEAVAKRPGWALIPAVRDKRVFLVSANLVSRAGPRLADGLYAIAKILHPGLFN